MGTGKSKCFARRHLKGSAYHVWDYAKAISKKTGKFYLDGPRVAVELRIAINTLYKAIGTLHSEGWIIRMCDHGRRADGTFKGQEFKVLSHDEWAKTHLGQCRTITRNCERSETLHSQELITASATPLPETANGPLPETANGPLSISGNLPLSKIAKYRDYLPVGVPEGVVGTEHSDSNTNSGMEPTADVDADTPQKPPSPGNLPSWEDQGLSAKRTTQEDLAGFMTGVQRVFDKAGCSRDLRTNQDHRQRAFALAQRYGIEVFLGGLEVWLADESTKERLTIGTRKTPYRGTEEPVIKTWLLKEFLDCGAGLAAIKKVAPYQGRVRGAALISLVQEEISPEHLTPACYDVFAWMEKSDLTFALPDVAENFDPSKCTFGEFLADFPEHYDARFPKSPRSEGLRVKYKILADRLRQEAPVATCTE